MAVSSRRAKAGWYVETADLATIQVEISRQIVGSGVASEIIGHAPDTPVEGAPLGEPEFWHGLFVPHLREVHVGGTPRTVLDMAVVRDPSGEPAPAGLYTLGLVDPGNCLDVTVLQDHDAAMEVYAAMIRLQQAQSTTLPHLSGNLLYIEHW